TRSARSTAEAGSGLRAGHLLLDELHVLAHDRIELLDLQLLRLGALVLRGVVVVAGAGARHQADQLTHRDPPWGPAVLADARPKAMGCPRKENGSCYEARRSAATAQADRGPSPRDGVVSGGAERHSEAVWGGGPC